MPGPPEEWPQERARLLDRIRLLEEDCALLADAQEELAALGLVSENVRETVDPREVIRAGLERVAILRALPFCACATLRGEQAAILEHYAPGSDAPLAQPLLPLSARLLAEARRGSCLLQGAACAEAGFDGERPLPLRPTAVAVLPFRSRDWGEGLFLFAHDRGPDELAAMLPLFSRVVELLVGRIDHVALVRDLQALNATLDEKVKERTRELLAQIQERQKTEEALRQAQRMESVGRLAGGVAHDFNNALTTVIGLADLLLADAPAGSTLAADLQGIREAGRHAASLTRQLLAFSRKQRLELAPLPLDEVVRIFSGMLGRVLGEDVELQIELGAGDGLVLADRSQLEQVLMNLAVNAREAMPGGGRLTLTTRSEQLQAGRGAPHGLADGSYLRLTVADSGQGMPPEVTARIFDPFFTTKERGNGLGLATVYGIVKQHGGQVAVDSAPGAGTRFDIWLPACSGEAPGQGAAPVLTPVPRLLGGTETVLIVDDDPGVLALLARVLGREGYRVLHAGSGPEALRVADEDGRVEALITDVVMPGMRGVELARAFLARWPDCPVLYLSGYSEDMALLPEGAMGDGFIPKPVVAAQLLSTLRHALDRVRATRPGAGVAVSRGPPRPGAA